MIKSRYFSKCWIIITVILCIVIAVFFFPIAAEKWGSLIGLLVTVLCIAFIWLVYFVRAHVFTIKRNEIK
jgi:hypothetical protein